MPQTQTVTRRRGRPRKVESFSDWMARIDIEVEEMTRKAHAESPASKVLTGPQRRIVEMLAEHLRFLPVLQKGEDPRTKPEFKRIWNILHELFIAKHPEWQPRKDGIRYTNDLPRGQHANYEYLLRNVGGYAPPECCGRDDDDDDDD